MTRTEFKKYMNIIKKYYDYEGMLWDLNINIAERPEVANLVTYYIELLSLLCKAPYSDEYGSDIEYFIYELNFGARWKPGMVKDEDGQDIPMGTVDDLWNSLVKNNPELEKE